MILDPPNPTVTYTFINCANKWWEENKVYLETKKFRCLVETWPMKDGDGDGEKGGREDEWGKKLKQMIKDEDRGK